MTFICCRPIVHFGNNFDSFCCNLLRFCFAVEGENGGSKDSSGYTTQSRNSLHSETHVFHASYEKVEWGCARARVCE